MSRIAAVAALATVGCSLVLATLDARQAAQPQSRTALILGQVVDGTTGRPMAGVEVTLRVPSAATAPSMPGMPSTSPRRSSLTNANGRFLFTELPAGSYTFSIASGSGDLIGGYGMRRPGGSTQTFDLAEGQRVADVTLRAWKYGAVGGTVVDQDGEPIPETRVTLLRVESIAGHRLYRVGQTTMTDDRGIYRIPRVEPGEYTVYLPYSQVTLPLEVQAAYDSAGSKGRTGREEFERTYGVDSSSVNGTGIRVGDNLLIRASNLMTAFGEAGASFASPPPDANERLSVYPMTFHPGSTALSEAATFSVEAGEDRDGTNVQVRLVTAVSISGRVAGVDGPAPMATVRLIAQSSLDADKEEGFETAKTVANEKGEFTLLGVPAGLYVLRVARVPNTSRPTTMTSVTVGGSTMFSIVDDSNLPPLPLPETPTESRSMMLAVGKEDIRNFTVQLQPGPRVSGRLAYDGTAPRLSEDQLVRLKITLDPVDGRVFPGASGKGQFDASGQFRTLGLLPGRYVLRLSGNLGGWSLGSVSIAGQILLDPTITIADRETSGVVITLTDRATSLSGSVRDSAGPDANAVVLVFPASRELWTDTTASPRRLRSVRASTRGTYQIDDLPAGEYVVLAIDDRFAADWRRPQRLEILSRTGTRITMGAGEKKTIELTTQVVR